MTIAAFVVTMKPCNPKKGRTERHTRCAQSGMEAMDICNRDIATHYAVAAVGPYPLCMGGMR